VIELRVTQGPAEKPIFAVAPENGTQGALVAISPQTGDVLALVGGNDNGDTEFDRALQARRQPGSAFKPLIFAAALDRGYTPVTLLDDAPVTFPDQPGKPWSPKNFTKRFYGPTTVREALTKSRNVPTVKLVDAIGLPYLLDYLPRFGFPKRFAANLSISLGTGETTLLELVRAYGVFGSAGNLLEPRFITKITDQHGNVLEKRPPQSAHVLSAATAYQMTAMLRGVVERGTGRRARLDRPAAGKTGTTNDQRDAWFVGFTPEIAAGVWVGYDRGKTLGRKETGGRVAAPIWRNFMEEALADAPVRDFPVPADVILVPVNAHTGARSRLGEDGSVLEAFRRGTEPGRMEWPS
jgi:penicillin-binding protein 1A